ncbi:unnamed protein product [Gongylonema pulchrum]|uniref:Solute carrier family 35 member F5 n=1 Tax=Gongylonema pulchrum TaxID=637853 RepID=A0A183DFD3_9BILA|nr:unnamed protein product [Gongylonema pulchrum]
MLHCFAVERLFPLPNQQQFWMLLLNGLVGTVFSDVLWLYASMLTSPVAGAVSLSLSIPFSLAADSVVRAQPPTRMQIIAAMPIIVSFIGAAFLNPETVFDSGDNCSVASGVGLEEAQSLISGNSGEDEDNCHDNESEDRGL